MVRRGLHHGEVNVAVTTYVLTFFHVVSSASRLYRSSSEMVPSILPLSLRTVDIIFLSAASFFSTLWTQARSSVAEKGNKARRGDTPVDHVHDLGVDLALHALLLVLEFGAPVARCAQIEVREVKDGAGDAERPVRHATGEVRVSGRLDEEIGRKKLTVSPP